MRSHYFLLLHALLGTGSCAGTAAQLVMPSSPDARLDASGQELGAHQPTLFLEGHLLNKSVTRALMHAARPTADLARYLCSE